MTVSLFENPQPRDHLIIPPNPVPNGGLHLGHMAGPFLRLDILARHLRRRGDRVSVIFGTHPFDGGVPVKSEQAKRPPREIAATFYGEIERSLQSLDIGFDTFIDPTAPAWSGRYERSYRDLVARLRASGHVVEIEEQLPFDEATQSFAVGCDLLGRCPECSGAISGAICEDCGSFSEPRKVSGPFSRQSSKETSWRPIKNLFFRIDDPEAILRALAETETPQPFLEVCERHFRQYDEPRIRLTQPGTWGVPWPDAEPVPRILVDSGFLFGYCHLCGEIYAEKEGKENPFHSGSSTVVINGFGIDNVITHMVYIQAMALAQSEMRSFDRFVVNHFYLLEGEKFSTSRGHAIWATDLVGLTPVSSDAVRYALAATTPTHQRESFELDAFVHLLNERLAGKIQPALDGHFAQMLGTSGAAPRPGPAPEHLVRRLRDLVSAQEAALEYRRFDPRGTVVALDDWVESSSAESATADDAYWWLKGFSLLAEPIMPRISREIWLVLGAADAPSHSRFLASTRPLGPPEIAGFETVRLADLAPCLPATLDPGTVAAR